jgi:hypothetical protein
MGFPIYEIYIENLVWLDENDKQRTRQRVTCTCGVEVTYVHQHIRFHESLDQECWDKRDKSNDLKVK